MRKGKRAILMDVGSMQHAIDLARIGIGTKEIQRLTGLSEAQIGYRLHTYKETTGMEKGLRTEWRNGNSPLLNRILKDYAGIMNLEFERQFLPKVLIVKPKPIKVPKA